MITRTEGVLLEDAASPVNAPNIPSSRVQHIEGVVVEPRRMWHGEAHGRRSDLVADLGRPTPPSAMLTPAVCHVGGGNGADIRWGAIAHGHAIQVTAVFGRELADEGRMPSWREAVRLAVVARQPKSGRDE
jgi:hypothetical protein